MVQSISAYEAPALLNVHPTLSKLDLYERLTGAASNSGGKAGLQAFVADGVIDFVTREYGWNKPIRRSYSEDGTAFNLECNAYAIGDTLGEFVVVFVHMADYLHRQTWGKTGVPPESYLIQANWVMHLSKFNRLAFVVLADKKVVIYHVARDETVINRIKTGIAQMEEAIAAKRAPALDEVAIQEEVAPVATANADVAPADLDALAERWRAGLSIRADAQNKAQLAEHVAEAAAKALKAAIKPGTSHEYDGSRFNHNAKTGRLTEEKINGEYF